jgi:hypothetical protein
MSPNSGVSVSSSIVLKAGDLQATFLPESGMRCVSFKHGQIALIEEGLVIGPHFGKRSMCSPKDPYPFGLGRYGSWDAAFTETSFDAKLTGEMTHQTQELKTLEGQNFKMSFRGNISPSELLLSLSVVSESDSLIGIEYMLPVSSENGPIQTTANRKIYRDGEKSAIPDHWEYKSTGELCVPTSEEYAFSFSPEPNPTEGQVIIGNSLKVEYSCASEESSWMIRNQPSEKLLSLGAVTSQNPWKPNLTVSSITIKFVILSP